MVVADSEIIRVALGPDRYRDVSSLTLTSGAFASYLLLQYRHVFSRWAVECLPPAVPTKVGLEHISSGMTIKNKLSAPKQCTQVEGERLVEEFVSSSMPRGEFCRSRGLSFGALDRHLEAAKQEDFP